MIEAGLLFAKDSTRVWNQPRCQIITNINKQHLEWVRPKNLRAICQQKVGHLSKKTTIYIGKQEPNVNKIIKQILKKNPSKKVFYGNDWTLKKEKGRIVYKDKKRKFFLYSKNIFSNGVWQNVGLAIRVALDLNISQKKILRAIPKIYFEGRMQYITKGKLRKSLHPKEKLLLDGCHSEISAKNLASHLKQLSGDVYGVWGMQANKNPEIFLRQFKGIFKKIVTVKIPDEPNACDSQKLQKIANKLNIESDTAPNIRSAMQQLADGKEKTITCFGSLYLVGKILSFN